VKFGVPDEEEKLFWSAGKDGKIKQWDAIKFNKVQTLDGHVDEVRALATTGDGKTLVSFLAHLHVDFFVGQFALFKISTSNDRSIRIWELTDQIIVLQEEEERELEKESEAKLLESDDIIPGEPLEKEVDLAPIKSIESIKSVAFFLKE